jgi:hypothetical protein
VAPPAGRLLYLRLDDNPAGVTARDDSGHGQMATLVGFDLRRPRPYGRYGTGLAFAGGDSGGWVRVASHSSLNQIRVGFTIAAWLHAPEGAAASGVILARRASGPGGFVFGLQVSGGKLRVRINSNNGFHADVSSATDLPRGRWVHVAATYDLAQVRTFVDGEPAGMGPYTHALPDDVSNVTIGAGETAAATVGDRFAGRLDELLLYDRPLRPSELGALARSVPLQ